MSKTVIATVNLADPEGGRGLPAGVPVQVDDSNETIKGFIDAGYLQPVKLSRGQQEAQTWRPGDPEQEAISEREPLRTISGGAEAVPPGADATPGVELAGKAKDTPSTEAAAEQAIKEERRSSRKT